MESSSGSSASKRFENIQKSEGAETSNGFRCTEAGSGMEARSHSRAVKVHTGFRISPLVELLSSMTGEKEEILKELKFDGLKHLPIGETESDRPFKLPFSLWLAMRLKGNTDTLELGKRGCIPIKNEDVGLVLGIASIGEELDVHDPGKLEENKEIIRRNLILKENEELDLETVKEVLQRDISNDTDGSLRKAFMTALVIYAVSYFLAPKGRPPKINAEILDSIKDQNRIPKLNWASYVLKTLRESASKVKSDMASKKSSVCLDGCLLFLQVLYLDNINFSTCRRTQTKMPRVADFSYKKINDLIKMDKCKGAKGNSKQYGGLKLKHESETVYSRGEIFRASNRGEGKEKQTTSDNFGLQLAFDYIDKKNAEHKLEIRQACKDFAEQMCNQSDTHMEDVKKKVYEWMQKIRSTGRKGVNRANDIDNSAENNKGNGEKEKGSTFKCNKSNERKGDDSKDQVHCEVVDLTGEDEDNDTNVGKRQNVNNRGERHGTKRAANRTPLAIRTASLADPTRDQNCDNKAYHGSSDDNCARQLKVDQETGTNIGKETEKEFQPMRKLRTKHPAKRTKTDKKKHVPEKKDSDQWGCSE